MPRRRINTPEDASIVLGDCIMKAVRGEMPPHQLQAITTAISLYNTIKANAQGQEMRQEAEALVDAAAEGKPGVALHLRHEYHRAFR